MKNMSLRAGLCLSVALLLALAGCSTPPVAHTDMIPNAQFPNIIVEGNLRQCLLFAQPIVLDNPGQPLKVVVPVRSTSMSDVHARYRFTFLDANRVPLHPDMDLRSVVITQDQTMLEGSALDTNARYWHLTVTGDQ